MASGGAHVRAEATERHTHHHVHLTSSSHPVKPAQFAFTVSREPLADQDTIIGSKASRRPATARLDLSYASNARPLVRSLSAHSPSHNFLDLRIVSDEDSDLDREGMDVDELQSQFRGWSFDKGNVKMADGEVGLVGRESASTRVSVSFYCMFFISLSFRACRTHVDPTEIGIARALCQVDLRAVRGGGCPASAC